jgi:hypothetical protein
MHSDLSTNERRGDLILMPLTVYDGTYDDWLRDKNTYLLSFPCFSFFLLLCLLG